jgi:hypothetical protein
MEYFMNLIKSVSLVLIALAASQSGMGMEKEDPNDILTQLNLIIKSYYRIL